VSIPKRRTDSSVGTAASSSDVTAEARIFRVLGDPTRLRILELLAQSEPLSVSEISLSLGVGRSKASNHLACLKWCDLVTSEQAGRRCLYRLKDRAVIEILDLARRLAEPRRGRLASCERLGPEWL
jgi:DNA-binding transcriptional ArsR family regulator